MNKDNWKEIINKVEDTLDVNKDGKIDISDINAELKKSGKTWKTWLTVSIIGLFLIIVNFGPTLLEMFVK
mgnify:CR=1 FL=1